MAGVKPVWLGAHGSSPFSFFIHICIFSAAHPRHCPLLNIDSVLNCYTPSPRRPYEEDKRMVLEHTHGLFIT